MITSHSRPLLGQTLPLAVGGEELWFGRGRSFCAMLENPKFVPMARPYAFSRRAFEGVVRAESDIDDPTSAPRSLHDEYHTPRRVTTVSISRYHRTDSAVKLSSARLSWMKMHKNYVQSVEGDHRYVRARPRGGLELKEADRAYGRAMGTRTRAFQLK